jgi:hypothetical protein
MRARELEQAFKQKHDPAGSSIEHLPPGKDAADEIIERALSVSLFTPMRFLRADDLVASCPKAKWKPLVNALTRDPERVIVVSVEEEKPDASKMKMLADVPKLIINDYAMQQGRAFRTWVGEAGAALGVMDAATLDALARGCDGDAWLASNELMKLAAGGSSTVAAGSSVDGYSLADAFVRGDRNRHGYLGSDAAAEGLSYPLLQQSIMAERISHGDSAGIPPFISSKFKNLSPDQASNVFSSAILIHYAQRNGLASDQEALDLLP